MKKLAFALMIVFICVCLSSCTDNKKADTPTTTSETTTQKAPGKYAESKYLGTWCNASNRDELVCELKDDGTASFRGDTSATWEETPAGVVITSTVDGKKTTMEGYFVIVGEGYVARATETNMHYLDEGGVMQFEIMLTENTCVDCVKK